MSKVGTIMKVGGKVGGRAAGRAVNILPLITEAIGYYKIRSEERTKREEIWAKRDVLVTALNNEKESSLPISSIGSQSGRWHWNNSTVCFIGQWTRVMTTNFKWHSTAFLGLFKKTH